MLKCQRDSNHAAQVVDDLPVVEDTVVHSVLVESCSGWRLNKVNKYEQSWTNLNKVEPSLFFLLLLTLALPSCLRWRHSSPQTLRPCTSAPSTRRWPVRCWRRWRWSKWWGRGWSWCRVTDTQGSNVVMMITAMAKVPGKSPEAAFLNKTGEEVERVVMTGMTRYTSNWPKVVSNLSTVVQNFSNFSVM